MLAKTLFTSLFLAATVSALPVATNQPSTEHKPDLMKSLESIGSALGNGNNNGNPSNSIEKGLQSIGSALGNGNGNKAGNGNKDNGSGNTVSPGSGNGNGNGSGNKDNGNG
jgi:hypothetical protein